MLGPGEGEVEAAARAALLDAAHGEDTSGWEGAATGGNSVDELAGWDGIKKEEITDGLRVVKGEDILPAFTLFSLYTVSSSLKTAYRWLAVGLQLALATCKQTV